MGIIKRKRKEEYNSMERLSPHFASLVIIMYLLYLPGLLSGAIKDRIQKTVKG